MASPLEDIDWDNLSSAEVTTVVKILCRATQERYGVAFNFFTGGKNYFPTVVDNGISPKFKLNPGDPLQDFSFEVRGLLEDSIAQYVDIEKIDGLVGTVASPGVAIGAKLNSPANDSITYDNRLFEITGYTQWPDLSVYAPEELKKWYDMLTTLKYIIPYFSSRSLSFSRKEKLDGVFDLTYDSLDDDDDDARVYGSINIFGAADADLTNLTPYNSVQSDNNGLWSTLPDTYTEIGTNDSPINDYPYRIKMIKTNIEYGVLIKAYRVTFVDDFTNLDNLSYSGRPIDYNKSVASYVEIDKVGVGGVTLPVTLTTNTVNEIFRAVPLSATDVGNQRQIVTDDKISPVNNALPNPNVLANGTYYTHVEMSRIIIENWDGVDGFVNYTPIP